MKKSRRRRQRGLGAEILAAVLLLAGLSAAAYQLYITVHFRLYSAYKADLSRSAPYAADTAFAPLAGGAALDGYALAMENDTLRFYADAATGGIAVYDKRTDQMTYSNPPGADADPLANGVNKAGLKSQLVITYFDYRGKTAEFSSYEMAAKLGQIELKAIPDGIRFVYTFGDTKPKAGILPLYIKESRLDEILSQVEDERTRGLIKRRWEAYGGAPGVMNLLTSIVNNPAQQSNIIKQFEKIGYTDEDRRRDEADSGVETADNAGFVIPLEYRLEGDSFTAVIPAGHIDEIGGVKLEGVRLLPFLAAGGADEEGYIIVPNGSGSLIRFNNGRTTAEDYRQFVYGQDPLLMDNVNPDKAGAVRLPIFGIQKNGRGLLARIEKGAPLAQLTASVAGKLNSYNYVNAAFILRGAMSVDMGADSGSTVTSIPVVEKPKADLDITVRYTFLDKTHDGYAGMARYERERLIREGVLTPKVNAGGPEPETSGGDIPFYMDFIGSAQGRRFFLDIAYQGQIAMTTYAQAAEITDKLAEAGVRKQIINYQGWFNRGYYHDAADKIKPVAALGSVKTLEQLAAVTEARGGRLYSDVLFQKVPFSAKRFRYVYETSKYYGSGMIAAFGYVSPLNYIPMSALGGYTEMMYDQLSPRFLGRYADSFIRSFAKYNLGGVSLRDLADSIASDRKRTGVIDRAQAEDIIRANLARLAAAYPLQAQGGNYYALGYVDGIIGAPLYHNAYFIVNDEIPFYEMILSGCVDYAGDAINLSPDADEAETVLKLVETGAPPRFTFTAEDTGKMKYTALHPMYSTAFSVWEPAAERIYNTVNNALRAVYGRSIIDHAVLQDGVRRVTYDGGTRIYINYNDYPVTADGTRVGAKSYAVVEGGAP